MNHFKQVMGCSGVLSFVNRLVFIIGFTLLLLSQCSNAQYMIGKSDGPFPGTYHDPCGPNCPDTIPLPGANAPAASAFGVRLDVAAASNADPIVGQWQNLLGGQQQASNLPALIGAGPWQTPFEQSGTSLGKAQQQTKMAPPRIDIEELNDCVACGHAKDRVEKLKAEMTPIVQHIKDYAAWIKQADEVIAKLERQKESSHQAISRFKEQLHSVASKHKTASSDLRTQVLKHQLAQVHSSLAIIETQSKDLNTSEEELNAQKRKLKERIQELENEVSKGDKDAEQSAERSWKPTTLKHEQKVRRESTRDRA